MKPLLVAPALAGLVCLSLLASACQGSANVSTTSAQSNKALAFSHCMRSHGVPSFPDPGSGGVIPKESLQQLGVSSSQFESAQGTCQPGLPNGSSGPTPAQVQQEKATGLRFTQCVRSHGIPKFPDPGSDGRIPDPASVGIDQGSPRFEAANQACRRYRPPYMPSNADYNAYARTR